MFSKRMNQLFSLGELRIHQSQEEISRLESGREPEWIYLLEEGIEV